MKNTKVARVLSQRFPTEANPIEVLIFASGDPFNPWAAMAEGQTHRAQTLHGAFDSVLAALAKSDRAAEEL